MNQPPRPGNQDDEVRRKRPLDPADQGLGLANMAMKGLFPTNQLPWARNPVGGKAAKGMGKMSGKVTGQPKGGRMRSGGRGRSMRKKAATGL